MLFLKIHKLNCIKNNLPIKLPNYWYNYVNKEEYNKIKKTDNNKLNLEQLAYKYFIISLYTFNKNQLKQSYYCCNDNKIINEKLYNILMFNDCNSIEYIKDYFNLKEYDDILENIIKLDNYLDKYNYLYKYINILFFYKKFSSLKEIDQILLKKYLLQIKDDFFLGKKTKKEITNEIFFLNKFKINNNKKKNLKDFLKKIPSLKIYFEIKHIENILKTPIENMHIYNLSYDKFPFENYKDYIIYADPPYFNTIGYDCGDFDFKKFSKFCANIKQTLFISELTNPNPNVLKMVFEYCIKDNVSKNKKRKEQLFYNFI